MLASLSIKNYALIDDISISFYNGLGIITGETGAGKSIMLGALSLILGKRADSSNIKEGEKKCIIEAVFNISKYDLEDFFESNNLDFENNTIIRREVLAAGKSRAFINDTPVTLDILEELGSNLLDIHSQHQTLKLTDDGFQFQLLDALADTNNDLETYKEDLQTYKDIKTKISRYNSQKLELEKELDYNKFLLQELEELPLDTLNLEELEEEMATLSNVEVIQDALGSTDRMLSDETIGLLVQLDEILSKLGKITSFNKDYQQLTDRFSSLSIELYDLQSELENLYGDLNLNPERLEELNATIQLVHNLMRKHQVTEMSELIDIRDALSSKIYDTEQIDSTIEELTEELSRYKKQISTQAEVIYNKRKAIIPTLEKDLIDNLAKLGMPNARIKFDLQHTTEFSTNGADDLKVLLSANKGNDFKDLKKSASGGELSRIMLAIKYIISRYIQLPSIIFDEIDTGVSGEISNKMGSIMKDMSKYMQVISITHLPQIAAKGDTHYKVYKEELEFYTATQIKELNLDERIVEIAEMLGGRELSNSAIAHAKQLLN